MDNLSAGIGASSGFFGRMYRLYGDLSSVTTLQSGVAESIGIGCRLPSEWGGGINRNQVADCVGIRKSWVSIHFFLVKCFLNIRNIRSGEEAGK